MRKAYFKKIPDAPEPLRLTIKREVRFEEVDSMNIVWHGRYVSYFEEGRVALGKKFGISYSDFIKNRVPVPIRQIGVDFLVPLLFEDEIEIETILHWSDAARINFEYIIRRQDKVVCTGFSVQMMLNEKLELQLEHPKFYAEFMDKWAKGILK